jgi:hypothetical protein
VAIITLAKRRAGGIYFAPSVIILVRTGDFYIEHNIQGGPVFFNSVYFALREMPLDPAAGRGLPGYYGTANPGAFFTGPHQYSP